MSHGEADAGRFVAALAGRSASTRATSCRVEDVWYYLWRERPCQSTSIRSGAIGGRGERKRLAAVFQQGLKSGSSACGLPLERRRNQPGPLGHVPSERRALICPPAANQSLPPLAACRTEDLGAALRRHPRTRRGRRTLQRWAEVRLRPGRSLEGDHRQASRSGSRAHVARIAGSRKDAEFLCTVTQRAGLLRRRSTASHICRRPDSSLA